MNTNKASEARFGTNANVNVWDNDREVAKDQSGDVKDYSGGYHS